MESYEVKFARRKRFQRIVSMLCCICVFFTTYALILPAITMGAETDCGMEEHTHGDACYEQLEQVRIVCDVSHKHDAGCYDESGALICGKEEVTVVHTHDSFCFDESGALICTLPEVYAHTHTDECYESIQSEPKLICEKEEDEHAHSDACRLTCKLSEEEAHVHTDDCLGNVLVCDLDETAGHTHGDDCYGEPILTCEASKHEHTDECYGELICEMDGVEGHEHTRECYELTCEESKHVHTDECYTKPLVCELEESDPHTHDENCYESKFVCGMEEGDVHTHSDACYGEEYVCGHEPHAHSDECYEASEPARGALTCTQQEIVLHTHSDACYADVDGVRTLVCTMPTVIAHQHTANCVQTTTTRGALTCEIEEHTHTTECVASVSAFAMPREATTDNAYRNLSDYTGTSKINVSVKTTTFDGKEFLSGLTLEYELVDGTLYDKVNQTYYLNYKLPLADKMSVGKLDVRQDAYDENYDYYLTKNGQEKKPAFQFCFIKDDNDNYFVLIEYTTEYADFVTNNTSPTTGKLEFEAKIDKDALTPNGDIVVPWDDVVNGSFEIEKEKITYNDYETANTDIHSSKTGSYDATNKTLTYTVTVWSNNGTGDGIEFHDEMNLKHDDSTLTLGTPTITVKKYKDNQYQSDVFVSDSQFGGTDEKKTLDMTLPALNAGEKYEVTYTYSVTVPNGTAFWQNNKVKVSADPTEGHIEHESECSVSINRKLLKKTGSYDQTKGTINWTITVNENNDNIAGYTLTDSWFSGLKEADIAISPNNGYTIKTDNSGNITGILFSGDNNENCIKYTITYSTSHDQTNKNQTVNNKVTIEKDDDKDEENASVTIPAAGVEKTAKFDASGNIEWTIVFDIPKGGIKAGMEIQDYSSGQYGSIQKTHWLTSAQRTALISKLNEQFGEGSIEILFADNQNSDWSINSWVGNDSLGENDLAYGWKVTFTKDVERTAESVKITYTTTPNYDETSTFYNYVKYGDEDDREGITKGDRISKMNGSGSTETSVNYNTDGTIDWFIKVNAKVGDGTLTVTDFIPDGLVVKDVGFGWNSYSGKGVPTKLTGWIDNLPIRVDVTKENYTTEESIAGQKVIFNISRCTDYQFKDAQNFDKDITIYLSIKCELKPDFIKNNIETEGSTKEFTFTNVAELDGEQASQTQKWTLKREVAVLKYDAKNDSNGTGVDTNMNYNAKDNTLAWFVRIYLEDGYDYNNDGFLVINETLPAGLTIKSVGVGYTAESAKAEKNKMFGVEPQFVTGSDAEIKASFTNDHAIEGGINERIYLCGLSNNTFPAGTYIYLYIECTIDSDATFTKQDDETEIGTFKNQASLSIGKNTIGSDEQTQTVKKTGNEEKLIKSSVQSTTFIDYTVVINGEGKDLNQNSDSLSFTDILTYENGNNGDLLATLKPTSVILWYAQKQTDGTYKKVSQVPTANWSWTYTSETPIEANKNHTHTMIGTVPDGTALILSYTYDLSFGNNSSVNFSVNNSFKLQGENIISDSSYDWVKWDSSIPIGSASSLGSLEFYKVKQGDFTYRLKNAEFSVYEVSANGSDIFKVALPSDEDGFFSVKHEYVKQGYYTTNTLYYITETKAPDGYVLPAKPQKYYFYFPDEGNTTQTQEELNKLIDKVKTGDSSAQIFNLQYLQSPIFVENEPIDTKLDIEKSWLSYDGQSISADSSDLPENIEITLYREAVGSAKTEVGKYTLEKSEDWKLTIENLPMCNVYGKEYIYSVKENLTGWTLTSAKFEKVYRTVGGEKTEEFDGKITMENTEKRVGEIKVIKNWATATTPHDVSFTLYQYKTENKTDVPNVQFDENDNVVVSGSGAYVPYKTIVIHANSSYEYTFTELPLFGKEDGKEFYYYYFVAEEPNGYIKTYTTSQQANADSNEQVPVQFMTEGTVTITNSIPMLDVTAQKTWGDVCDSDQCDVTFKLMQVRTPVNDGATTTSQYGNPITINAEVDWKHMWENLPAWEMKDGLVVAKYSYYVVEELDSKLFKVTYSNGLLPSAVTDADEAALSNTGTITVTNSYAYIYTLPKTGGSGTQMFTVMGTVLMVGCAMLLCFTQKRSRGA